MYAAAAAGALPGQGQKNPYIATVHRLDKITGGVMVFSRRREVTGKLTAAVQAHELVKEYLAVLRAIRRSLPPP